MLERQHQTINQTQADIAIHRVSVILKMIILLKNILSTLHIMTHLHLK